MFCIYNKQYSKNDYINVINDISYNQKELLSNKIKKDNIGENIIKSEFISNSSNIKFSKDIYDCQNIKYSYDLYNGCNDCIDCFS